MTAEYSEARADFEYLETLAELDDQVELDAQREALMQNPTKTFAAKLYVSAIRLWLQEHWNDFVHIERVRNIEDRWT